MFSRFKAKTIPTRFIEFQPIPNHEKLGILIRIFDEYPKMLISSKCILNKQKSEVFPFFYLKAYKVII